MPAPGSRCAPEFDLQNPEELKEFLEEFEELAERHGLITKEKTKMVVKYVDKETKKFWKRLEGFGDDYMILKRKIIGAYSKTLLEDKPTVAELVKLIKKSAKGSIVDEEDLDTYYRRFWIVAADLVEADIINKKQHNKYFWKGLPRELRYAISDRLEARDTDFESDQVLEVEKAMEVDRFVLRKAAARGGWGRMLKKGKKERRKESSDEESEDEVIGVEAGLESDSEEEERKKRKKSTNKEMRVRKVRFEDEGKKKEEGQEKVDKLTRKLLQLNIKDDTYAAAYAQLFILVPTMTENLLPPSRFAASIITLTSTTVMPSHPRYSSAPMSHNFPCHFCKKLECRLRTCPTAAEYVQSQRVLLQANEYYTHMDGSPIDARHLGELKGVIDVKLNIRDLPPHLFNMAPIPVRFSLFVEAIQEEEDKFVWGTMAELKEEVKESVGLVTTRAQERKREVAEVTDRKKYAREDTVSRREEKKVEAHQPAYRQEP